MIENRLENTTEDYRIIHQKILEGISDLKSKDRREILEELDQVTDMAQMLTQHINKITQQDLFNEAQQILLCIEDIYQKITIGKLRS